MRALGSVAAVRSAGWRPARLDAMLSLRPMRSVDVAAGAADRPRGGRRGGAARRGWRAPLDLDMRSRVSRRASPSCSSACWTRIGSDAAGCNRTAHGATRQSRLLWPGIRRRRRGRASSTSTTTATGSTTPRCSSGSASSAIPPAWDGRLDLPLPDRPHPGDRHRRRRPQAVPLPRALARAARPREVRRDGATSRARCPRCARRVAQDLAPAGCRASASSPAPCACSTAASSGSAPRTTPRRTRPTGSRRCSKRHVTLERATRSLRLRGQGRQAADPVDRSTARSTSSSSALKRRRGGSEELLAYKDGRGAGSTSSRPTSTPTSRRSRAATSRPRTSAPGAPPCSPPSRSRCRARRTARRPRRKRAKARARQGGRRTTSATRPPSCRASYIDPRVFDRFDGGLTIGGVLLEQLGDAATWRAGHRRARSRRPCSTCIAGDRDSTGARELAGIA